MLQYFEAPEQFGIRSQTILDFLDACKQEQVEIHSLELRRGGRRILAATFAPFTGRSLHRMYSSGKALCSLAFLFAMQDGLIGLDERLADVFADRLPRRMSEYMDEATMYHMLTMSSGHDHDVFAEIRETDDWVKAFMSIPPSFRPGSRYVYNNGTPHMVAEAVRLRTGQKLKPYLEEKLLSPMGETMEISENGQGEPEPSTISISIEGFGKLADFLYHHGSYGGRQLLRPELSDLMGQRHLPTPVDPRVPEGYLDRGCNGYGFHVRGNGIGGYKLSGGRSQKACIFPEYQMTAAIMANEPREGLVMHLLSDRVMRHVYQRPLPENPETALCLRAHLEQLNLGPDGAGHSELEQTLNGKRYILDKNEDGRQSLSLEFEDDRVLLRLDETEVAIGKAGKWLENTPYFLRQPGSFRLNRIPGSRKNLYTGAWASGNEFVFYIRSASRMATDKVFIGFDGDRVTVRMFIDPQRNAGSKIEPVVLTGVLC